MNQIVVVVQMDELFNRDRKLKKVVDRYQAKISYVRSFWRYAGAWNTAAKQFEIDQQVFYHYLVRLCSFIRER